MSRRVDPQNTIADRRQALRFLEGRIDYERIGVMPYRPEELKLDRMRGLLARLGDPQKSLRIVHVAGTKGKGSTAAMVGAVLSAAGNKTGVFTSPHLDRIEERIAVDSRPCSAGELVELVTRLAPVVEAMDVEAASGAADERGPTYFEITTAMALLHFALRHVDAAVLEVGLGGRLDSTNVCTPLVSVITSISLDHTRQLGNSLESIAREKAGIIKPTVPVVSGVTEFESRGVIREICRERGCRLIELGADFDFSYRPPHRLESAPEKGKIDFRCASGTGRQTYRDVPLGLLGRHQAANAAVAIATLVQLQEAGWEIPERAVRDGLAEVVWPGRVELVARRPAIVVDSAHNGASIDALVGVLEESFSVRRRLLVFATTQEKDIRGMLRRLLPSFDEVIFTQYLNNPRFVPPEALSALSAELTGRPHRVCDNPREAWNAVRSLAGTEDLVVVTGSMFIAAEMRREILARPLGTSDPVADDGSSPASPIRSKPASKEFTS